jgi:hypothetical protein
MHDPNCTRCRQNAANRQGWPAGPWLDEPDREEFEHKGLPCILARSPVTGAWCGYVGLAPGHPCHKKGFAGVDTDDVDRLEVHGGITFAQECCGCVCHVPKAGEPEAL